VYSSWQLLKFRSPKRSTRSTPDKALRSLEKYTREHLVHEYHTQKSCAPHCTVSCVQQVAMLDNWRSPQTRPAFVPVENLLPFPNSLSEG
jgi:hypothetical protein